ncbi:MAG: C4-type zinc ribbon domain-containing protein [bacterium]|jgi:predicted  nucleic acid-binding Zn-ribbon protein|nr:C4-type zinc ribbon domain-containing protein [bacterium]
MNTPELALHHQRLEQRASQLEADVRRVSAQLASNPEVERRARELEEARQRRQELELRVRERDRDTEQQRSRVASRERELMSGRIGNPTELMKLSAEVDHLKQTLSASEDVELELLEDAERQDAELATLEAALDEGRTAAQSRTPDLEARLADARAALEATQAELAPTWQQLPEEWRVAYQRVKAQRSDPVAEAVDGQCQGCRVAVTSSGMQTLRRAGLVRCDNCGRILVVA